MICDQPAPPPLSSPQPAWLGWTGQEWQPQLLSHSPDDDHDDHDDDAKDEISKNTVVICSFFSHLTEFSLTVTLEELARPAISRSTFSFSC